jgi:uncharacterized membrane protein
MTSTSALGQPQPSTVTVSHVVYALHAFAIVTGIVGTATVVGSFIGSVPSILAVVLSYLKRGSARGTWLESHYSWQIRTFWYALASFLIAWALIVTLIGALVGIPLLIVLTLWLVYRIARGWLRLLDRKPV